ncbi:MAG: ATP-dependent RecD-like DNA helicase [Oscillospiraceae bacterium]|nr:ATP-dependent RecD-like DNA helicase [Oscillospiraceae bacterium]
MNIAENVETNLEGTVDSIIYKNEQTDFCVLELETSDRLICVVGPLSAVCAGDKLSVTGEFIIHPSYGRQFKAGYYERTLPKTAGAIRKYLASGVIKGIGKSTAKAIVDKFGERSLEIMEKEPHRLSEVEGISAAKAKRFTEELKKLFGARSVMLFLEKFAISPAYSTKAWKLWGDDAVELIGEDPYILCCGDVGLSFEKADAIAQQLQIEPDNIARVKAGIIHVLSHNLSNGHTALPKEKLIQAAQALLQIDKDDIFDAITALILDLGLNKIGRPKEYIFLPEYYAAETYIASKLSSMVGDSDNVYEHINTLIEIEEESSGVKYEKLQREAIKMSQSSNVMILTGGPGTGKTTTLCGIISIYEQQGLTVSIAAPTGRAAKRAAEVTGRTAQTLHRLLEASFERDGFGKNENSPLTSDVVIIDEMSMVDTLLFTGLLKALGPDCRLVMVGDHHQLPSVGAGNVLRDLIESGSIPIVELKEIFRQSLNSLIVTNAHMIVGGQTPVLDNKDSDFFFLSRTNADEAAKTVAELAVRRLPKTYGFNPISGIQVLCPARKGNLGINNLNGILQSNLNPPSKNKREFRFFDTVFREGDKVMQNCNDYDIDWTVNEEKGSGIFNGDIGIIGSISPESGLMLIDFDGRMTEYPLEKLKELELAYAITVHKSQGNEFDAVILPLLDGYDKLYFRNLLYTAVTRAKKLVIIVGSAERVEYMTKNNVKTLRYTGLRYFLKK